MAIDVPSTRPLIDKLGVKEGVRITILHLSAPGFLAKIKQKTRDYLVNSPQFESDLIFLGVSSRSDLLRIESTIGFLRQSGALWIVYPKGIQTVTEANVREAGLGAGLVDNKVVSFSETQTALRFVIPVAKRKKS